MSLIDHKGFNVKIIVFVIVVTIQLMLLILLILPEFLVHFVRCVLNTEHFLPILLKDLLFNAISLHYILKLLLILLTIKFTILLRTLLLLVRILSFCG